MTGTITSLISIDTTKGVGNVVQSRELPIDSLVEEIVEEKVEEVKLTDSN